MSIPCIDKYTCCALGFMEWAVDHLERHPEEESYVIERLKERVKEWRAEAGK